MAISISTGLRNQLLVTGSLRDVLDLGFIHIYKGTPPADANQAVDGANRLVTITVGGDGTTGLSFDSVASNGSVTKNPVETWQGTVDLAGTATYYRHVGASDTGAVSSTEPRIQGSVAVAGADMNISDVNLILSAVQSLDYYVVNMPAA